MKDLSWKEEGSERAVDRSGGGRGGSLGAVERTRTRRARSREAAGAVRVLPGQLLVQVGRPGTPGDQRAAPRKPQGRHRHHRWRVHGAFLGLQPQTQVPGQEDRRAGRGLLWLRRQRAERRLRRRRDSGLDEVCRTDGAGSGPKGIRRFLLWPGPDQGGDRRARRRMRFRGNRRAAGRHQRRACKAPGEGVPDIPIHGIRRDPRPGEGTRGRSQVAALCRRNEVSHTGRC